ncbi:hypothetical protein J6590_002049 [Homalodisca vitripennis]|nr:hypothetical protein J6590_002049 [Homalodisca vitripennis]
MAATLADSLAQSDYKITQVSVISWSARHDQFTRRRRQKRFLSSANTFYPQYWCKIAQGLSPTLPNFETKTDLSLYVPIKSLSRNDRQEDRQEYGVKEKGDLATPLREVVFDMEAMNAPGPFYRFLRFMHSQEDSL